MASILYLLIPSRTEALAVQDWTTLVRPYALVSTEGVVLQQGKKALNELKSLVSEVRQVNLLLAAVDVSLFAIKVPDMPASKLKAALPNLLEDQVLTDASDLILQSLPVRDGVCTIAAVDKQWMEALYQHLQLFAPLKILAYAQSMMLAVEAERDTVLIENEPYGFELAIRHSDYAASGISVAHSAESAQSEIPQLNQMLELMAKHAQMTVYLPSELISSYQSYQAENSAENSAEILQNPDQATDHLKLEFKALDWASRIAGQKTNSLEFMSAISHKNQPGFNWSGWRWPLILTTILVVLNLLGLTIQAMSMKREARLLSNSLNQAYRDKFPKETVIRDPLAQIRQKINLSKKAAGLSTPDDFLVMTSQFAMAWDGLAGTLQNAHTVQSIEFREHQLFVKIKSNSALPVDLIKTELLNRGLSLISSTDNVLKISLVSGEIK